MTELQEGEFEQEAAIEKYKNDSLLAHITKRRNIQILEEILDRETSRLKQLQKTKQKPGKRLNKKGLQEMLAEVKPHIDEFLDVPPEMATLCEISYPNMLKKNYYSMFDMVTEQNPIKTQIKVSASLLTIGLAGSMLFECIRDAPPTMSLCLGLFGLTPVIAQILSNAFEAHYEPHRGFYEPNEESITVTRTRRTLLIPLIAHEYAHHVENMLSTTQFPELNSFREGLSLGAEKHIARIYKEKEDNDSFEFNDLNYSISTLTNAYSHMCKKFGRLPNKNLILDRKVRELDKYCIGNTYFRIEAESRGETVYRDALHELSYLREDILW